MRRTNNHIAKNNALTAARLRARMAFASTVQQLESEKQNDPKQSEFKRSDVKHSNEISPTAVTSNVRHQGEQV